MQQGNKYWVQLYIFGSYRVSKKFNDIDILIIYDSKIISPRSTHILLKPLVAKLRNTFIVPLHIIVLNKEEERDLDFIRKSNAVFILNIDLNNIDFQVIQKIQQINQQ